MDINDLDKEKIHSIIDDITKQYNTYPLSNEISQEHDKLLDCRHEIVIALTARVLEQNDTGEHIGTKEICKQNYHIPVPAFKDYHAYMKGFFDKLEKCITTSDQETTQEGTTNE